MNKKLVGLPEDLNFGALMSAPARAESSTPEAVIVHEAAAGEAVEKVVSPLASDRPRRRVPKSSDPAKPRTIHLSDKVYDRLKLMAVLEKCKISAIVSRLLDAHADKLSVKRAS
ncbi:MAG: hypothetical protein EB015_17445 [Methylocystaceae bacterium]|nr:hypothetical protein [Methylocystaceae bacterium]